MNANISVGTIAQVNFSKEITGEKFPGMAVIKASPEMGFLVWLGGFGGSYSRSVTVCKKLGDVTISETFLTVGNFYFLNVSEKVELMIEEIATSETYAEMYDELFMRLNDQFIKEPIVAACQKLGITKLWKHSGENVPVNPDVVTMDLTEKGQIIIEAQC